MAKNKSVNRMSTNNLASIFAPSLLPTMLKTDLENEPDEPTPEFMLDLHLQSDWQILSVQMLIDYQV